VNTPEITAESIDLAPLDAELSDEAIEVLAGLLIDDAMQDQDEPRRRRPRGQR
jgi:hypothetical protein